MATLRKFFVVFFSVAALLSVAAGVYFAIHSPLFIVQIVEVADQPENAPVEAQEVVNLAAVPVGEVNLFALDLASIERRIVVNPWVKQVRLQKRFPQTLSISLVYRQPLALVQSAQGSLSYVDEDGWVFGQVNLARQPDLPVLSGFNQGEEQKRRIVGALTLLGAIEKSRVGKMLTVASISWDGERGYRVLVTYPLGVREGAVRARAMVDFGSELEPGLDGQLERLSTVLKYLGDKSIQATQIWADSGKKIVVRTARGS